MKPHLNGKKPGMVAHNVIPVMTLVVQAGLGKKKDPVYLQNNQSK
jgi:hypothetical protein